MPEMDPDVVERLIDRCRMLGDWDGVLAGIKQYAHIFDVGDVNRSFQHHTLDAVRAYYWVVMAEAVFETKGDGDFYKAIDCCKRAELLVRDCVEANIIVSRVVIETCATLWNGSHENKSIDENPNIVHLDFNFIFEEIMKV